MTTDTPDCAWRIAELDKAESNGIKVMSTFACGGGSSMGYKLAGCDVIAANDIDPEMAWHYKRNLNPGLFYQCPIGDLLTADLPDELFNLDILDGSPPCSTFSTAGSREKSWGKHKHFREGQSSQVLSDLFFEYLDLVERLQPKVVIAENVTGIIKGKAKGYAKMICARLREIGYTPQVFQINAADCGVPQRRERVFFCAARNDLGVPKLEMNPQHRWVTAGEATTDLRELTDLEKSETALNSVTDKTWWPITKPGERYADAVLRSGQKEKLWNHKKLSPKYPSRTLTATDMLSHWSERRSFTFHEWKRLGSFPDDYEAKTDKIGKYMVGMSVPPRMAEAVARRVCSQWLGAE